MAKRPAVFCPCGSDTVYESCCGLLHRSEKTAVTAEQLMRSRYTAFVVGDVAYLLRTWSARTRPPSLRLEAREWTGLEILGTTAGTAFHSEGTVEFRASYAGGSQQENSYFTREDGNWVYVDAR